MNFFDLRLLVLATIAIGISYCKAQVLLLTKDAIHPAPYRITPEMWQARSRRRSTITDSTAASSVLRLASAVEPTDLQASPSGYGRHSAARVHVKVFRGPDDHHFAPHGFWIKHPADDGRGFGR